MPGRHRGLFWEEDDSYVSRKGGEENDKVQASCFLQYVKERRLIMPRAGLHINIGFDQGSARRLW
jgi:hypothetical protein